MSYELRLSYTGTKTVYAILRKTSDGTTWNGSTWETWANANLATYDIPLTSLGGDYQAANFPTAIAINTTVWVTYYERAGDNPALTDYILKSEQMTWTGTVLTPEPTPIPGITVGSVIDRVRALLKDEGESSRWSDAKIIDAIANLSYLIYLYHPYEFLDDDGTIQDYVTPDESTDFLLFDISAKEAIAKKIAAEMLSVDGDTFDLSLIQFWTVAFQSRFPVVPIS